MPAAYNNDQGIQWGHLRRPLAYAAVVFYLVFHAISGDRGIYALFKERRNLEVIQAELDKVTAQRVVMEHRARLLNSSSLDLDLLDEQARDVLGYAGQDEVIFYRPAQ